MSSVVQVPLVSTVLIKGLGNLILPFKNHFLEDGQHEARYQKWLPNNSDRYYVKSITGLEPPDRTIAISRTAAGGKFQGATTNDREIVALIGMNPDLNNGETYQQLRNELEAMCTTGYDPRVDIQLIGAVFPNDLLTGQPGDYGYLQPFAHEYGYVTKFEADIFSKDPVIQITFSMLNPTFRDFEKTSIDASDLSQKHPDVYNYGNWETGFQFAVKFTDDMGAWYIKQSDHQAIGMKFEMSFHTNDILSVSTIPGQRYVHYKPHRGKVQNKLSALVSGSEWIQLHPGHNHFLVPSKTGKWDWNGKLTFTAQYGGI